MTTFSASSYRPSSTYKPNFKKYFNPQNHLYSRTQSRRSISINGLRIDLRRMFRQTFLLRRKLLNLSYLHVLIFTWVLLIFYCERVHPVSEIKLCEWSKWDEEFTNETPRVALFGDPQIIDLNTYPGRNYIFQKVTEYITDYYHRKNWIMINNVLKPQTNFFMGDLFDGGREWKDDVWFKEYERYQRIFSPRPGIKSVMSLAGNHDIGFGNTLNVDAYKRFEEYFGSPNSIHHVANHTFVLLDTISMMNSEKEAIYQRPYDFINKYLSSSDHDVKSPHILLTHVPLYRDPSTGCGAKRESKKTLPYVKGYQYQTMVSPEVTTTILNSFNPIAVFSGDDHDACYVQHNYTIEDVKGTSINMTSDEYTVKSTSMAMGIANPGLQLLTLHGDSYDTKICNLPNPFFPFIMYFLLALFSSLILITIHFLPILFPSPVINALKPTEDDDVFDGEVKDSVALLPSSLNGRNDPVHRAVSKKTVSFEEDLETFIDEYPEARPYDGGFQKAFKSMMKWENWKIVVKEASFVALFAFGWYMFLGWSIYRD